MVDRPSQPRRAIVFSWPASASSSTLHIFGFAGSRQANQHVTRRAKGRYRQRYAVAGSTSIIGCAAENPATRQTGTFYILCLRDFEILSARDVKRDEGACLIFLAAYSASGHSSPWMTADSPRKVSIGPQLPH